MVSISLIRLFSPLPIDFNLPYASPGMFVSESKFLSAPASFVPHILNPNPQALLDLITKPAVEAALLIRLEKKAKWYGMELVLDEKSGELVPKEGGGAKVKVDEVVRLYRDYIIPLTKEVEVSSGLTFRRVCGMNSRAPFFVE